MNCQGVEGLFIEYLYGELGPEQVESVRAHLHDCPDCAARLAEFRRIRELITELPEPEPTRMAVNRVLARAREAGEASHPIWGLGWFKILAPLCVLVMVTGLAYYQLRSPLLSKHLMYAPKQEEDRAAVSRVEPASEKEQQTVAAPSQRPAPEAMPVKKEQKRKASPVSPQAYQQAAPRMEKSPAEPLVTSDQLKVELHGDGMSEGSRLGLQQGAPIERGSGTMVGTGDAPEAGKAGLSSAVLLDEAEKALEAKNYTQARRTFSAVLRRLPPEHPERPRALLGLARAREHQRDFAGALAAYRDLAHESPVHQELAQRKIRELAGREGNGS